LREERGGDNKSSRMPIESGRIYVGVIGYSSLFHMGRSHLREMAQNSGFVPKAVCDINADALRQAAQDFPGIETYASVDEMLAQSEVELCSIILPHNVHCSVALQCLRAGRHVVVEKPFALTVDECEEMMREAKRRKLVLSTYHNRHWDGNILTILRELSKIGRPFRWESHHGAYSEPGPWWRSSKEISGGLIFDWGAHYVEWMLQVLPYPITEISGFRVKEVWTGTSNEDEIEAVVRFGDRAIATHTATDLAMAGKDSIRITGTAGALVWNWGNVTVHQKDAHGQTVVTHARSEKNQGHNFYANVHDHLFKGEPLVITPELATRVIEVLDFAGRSAELGRALEARIP
jgi:scyllo-inositol 2-dehydrogenase (NADP+)